MLALAAVVPAGFGHEVHQLLDVHQHRVRRMKPSMLGSRVLMAGDAPPKPLYHARCLLWNKPACSQSRMVGC